MKSDRVIVKVYHFASKKCMYSAIILIVYVIWKYLFAIRPCRRVNKNNVLQKGNSDVEFC